MKLRYALVNGIRQKAQSKLRGACPNCGGDVVAKCGPQRVRHWSHLGNIECDPWREKETDWHRAWKALFPAEWQEFHHIADDGQRHIADVRTDSGWVIELQHSPIAFDERISRESFYRNMVWVVSGLRSKSELAAFRKAVASGWIVSQNPLLFVPRIERRDLPTLVSPSMPRVRRLRGARNFASRVYASPRMCFGSSCWIATPEAPL